MKGIEIKKAVLLFVFTALIGTVLSAQTRNEVVEAYNEGAKLAPTDVPGAIAAFEKVISLSDKVGETAADLKQKAVQILPGLYMKQASAKISEKKPGPEVVQAAKASAAAAEKYGTDAQKDNAQKLLVQAYNQLATSYFTQKDYEKATATFDSVLAINPDYLTAIYNKALIYRTQNNQEKYGETIDLYLSKLGPNDAERGKQASQAALEFYRAAGSQANQKENLDEALRLLSKAEKYGQDKDLNYYFADVYNKQKNYDKALEYAKKGLDMETGAADAKAKFFYQMAVAQAAKGQTAEACESFKNAMYGPFAEASKAQRTNLKCQ
ncbi:MAG TPA: tetratricopeptide repeat protein [Bacteroidales bacterium]|nr:tetratricopeptide repeat protein [Bacteroidales bacterium]